MAEIFAASSRLEREVIALNPLYARRPPSLFAKSTIESSIKQATSPSMERPTLLPPAKLRLALFVNALEKTHADIVNAFCERLTLITQEGNQKATEYQKQLKEKSDRTDTNLFWSMLKKVWSAFFSAVTMLFGVLNVSSGNALVGAALIISGTLSLANLVCTEMGVWEELAKKLAENDKDRQKQILFCIPLALTILSTGLALFGGAYNFADTKAFFSSQLGFALVASLSILNSVVEVGQGITQARLLYSEADLLKIQTTLESTSIQTKMCSEALGSYFEKTQKIFQSLSRIMDMDAQTNLSLLHA